MASENGHTSDAGAECPSRRESGSESNASPDVKKLSRWPDRVRADAASFYEWLSRPRVRLTVTGVILLLIAGLGVTSSVWPLPLVIVGALMVVIAWIGRRLDGHFAIEWGETGTQLEFRAMIKAAQPASPPRARTASNARALMGTPEPEPEPGEAEVVEGEAHTVEIDVAELTALIATVEAEGPEIAHADASAQATRNLRVAHSGARSSETARGGG